MSALPQHPAPTQTQQIVQPPYYVDTPHVYLVPPSPPPPRPRKPYTSTKVREMWTPEEHDRMLEGLRLYKRDWAKVTQFVGTRSAAQVRSHAQKYFDRVARDKTDDYVPRARPKRKSATPYPRKPRDDPTHHLRLQVPPQSPPVLNSPSVVAAQPLHLPFPQVYSPYMVDRSISGPHPTVPAPSPVSYISGYPSPVTQMVPPQQQQHHMYGVFSPLTPAYPPHVRSPAVSHPAVSIAPPPQPPSSHPSAPHVPTHSHPGGPLDNCPKCAALQRYGAVLQEIGDFSHSPPPQPTHHPAVSHSTPNLYPAAGSTSIARAAPARHHETPDTAQAPPTGAQSIKPDGVQNTVKGPADHRAHRAKVIKARKARSRALLGKQSNRSTHSSASEPSSESFNSIGSRPSRVCQPDSKVATPTIGAVAVENGVKRKNSRTVERAVKRARIPDRTPAPSETTLAGEIPLEHAKEDGNHGNGSSPSSSPKPQSPRQEESEDNGRKRADSPRVGTYSQREQKEIFDAVKSLQILAKTSSPSSSESKRTGTGDSA